MFGTMTIEVELKEIKSLLSEVNKKLSSLLDEREKDVMVVFISSRIMKARPNDVLIREQNAEFEQTGLKVESFIKIDKIATLSKRLIIGEIGEVGTKLKKGINDKIGKTLKL